jgi:hypothetical protein
MKIGGALGGSPTAGDRIESEPLNFTSSAGIAGVIAALAGAIPALLEALTVLELSDAQFIAVLALIGAGTVAFAIASAGDALARAYASAWVVARTDEEAAKPVLQLAAEKYAEARAPAEAPPSGKVVVAAPAGMVIKAVGGEELRVMALELAPGERKFRLLAAAPDAKAQWYDDEDVLLVS